MKITKIIANIGNFLKKKYKKTYLVYHFTANDGDKSVNNGNYFKNNVVKASAQYFVDDDIIVQSVEDEYVAYAVGGKKLSGTKGGKYHGICTNYNSINIELCDTNKNGKLDLSNKTRENAIELGKSLVKKYNIPKERVIRHYDVTGKNCPAYFVKDEKAWNEFKNEIFNTKTTTVTTSTTTKKVTTYKASVVKSLQKALNSSYKLKLSVDGVIGTKTKTVLKTYSVKNYTKNAYAKWIQQRLKDKGYNIKVDGKFGNDSASVLKAFQKENGLTVDGKCGYNTALKLAQN